MNAPTQTLHTELAEAYRLLAEWQAKHRTEFPGHTVFCEVGAGDHFEVSILVRHTESDRTLVFVQGVEDTVREAVEAALLGATTNVAEGRESCATP